MYITANDLFYLNFKWKQGWQHPYVYFFIGQSTIHGYRVAALLNILDHGKKFLLESFCQSVTKILSKGFIEIMYNTKRF